MDKLLKATFAGIILCGIVFGFVVGSRIDQSTITLLSGTLVGIAVAAPCTACIVWLVMRRQVEDERVKSRAMQMNRMEMTQPWQVQQPAMPDPALMMAMMMQQRGLPQGQQPQGFMPRQRQFYTIGSDGEPKQLTDGGGTEW